MITYIISCHCNIPEYIELQYYSLKKYFECEFEYIVINDGKDNGDLTNFYQNNMNKKISEVCEKLHIKCINVCQDLHKHRNKIFPNTIELSSNNAACRATIAYQIGLNNFKHNNGYLFMLDADMFFINNFNINEFMLNKNLAGIKQGIGYLWTGITIFNLNELNLDNYYCDCGVINNNPVDAGGYSYFFLQRYKDIIKYKPITCSHYTCPKSYEKENDYIKKLLLKYSYLRDDNSANKEIILNNSILHIRSGSNWDYRSKEFKYKELEIIKNFVFSS